MINHIQTLLHSVNKKQVGAGVAGFISGFSLALYLDRRGPVEVVVEPDPEDTRVLNDIELRDLALVSDPISEHFTVEKVKKVENEIVLDPPRQDPSIIAVDHDKIQHRDQLIKEFGYSRGMQLYQEEYSMGTETTADDSSEAKVISIFSSNDDKWDQEVEETNRLSASGPYVIHKDEFYLDELGYTQKTLTYYAGDDILCDEGDQPVYNYTEVVGELKFGHGSDDQNVFYARNDKLKAEYEIIHDRGHYAIEVLGLEAAEQHERATLKHSLRKFRPDD